VLRFVNQEQSVPVAWGSGLNLVAVETSVVAGAGSWGGGATYARPRHVEIPGREPVRIVDPVMLARLVAVGLVVSAVLWRRFNE
jgi:hypothetical protein